MPSPSNILETTTATTTAALATDNNDDDDVVAALKPAEFTVEDIVDNRHDDDGATPRDSDNGVAATVDVETGDDGHQQQPKQQRRQPPEIIIKNEATPAAAAAVTAANPAALTSSTPASVARAAAFRAETSVAAFAKEVDIMANVANHNPVIAAAPYFADVAVALPVAPALTIATTAAVPAAVHPQAPPPFQFGISQSSILAPVAQPPKKKRKTQDEFTISQKLDILSELRGPNAMRVPDLAAKHNTSRTSIYRWKKDSPRLNKLCRKEGKGGYKRVSHKRKSYNEEFTAEEKLAVVRQLRGEDAPSVRRLAERVGANHRSVYRWKKAEEKLVRMVECDGRGSCKRVGNDPLYRVKEGLKLFHAAHYEGGDDDDDARRRRKDADRDVVAAKEAAPSDGRGNPPKGGSDSESDAEEERRGFRQGGRPRMYFPPGSQPPLTGTIVAAKGLQIRDEMLAQHELHPFLTEDEVKGMREFTASNSWGRKIVQKFGWKSVAGGGGSKDDVPGGDDLIKMDPAKHAELAADFTLPGAVTPATTIATTKNNNSSAKNNNVSKPQTVKIADLKREINQLLRKLNKSERKSKSLQDENTRLKAKLKSKTNSESLVAENATTLKAEIIDGLSSKEIGYGGAGGDAAVVGALGVAVQNNGADQANDVDHSNVGHFAGEDDRILV